MRRSKIEHLLPELSAKYHAGASITGLAREYLCRASLISRLFKARGVAIRAISDQKRKYPLREDFLDKIDCEEKAYFLGIIYADGYNNTDRGSISLGLKESDRDVLDKLSGLIQPSKPLQFINYKEQNTKGYKNSKNQYRLVISSRRLSKRLSQLGCPKAKTHRLHFPSNEHIPNHLIHHFVRGYFDGDGSINSGERKYFAIVGTVDFLDGLQELLVKELKFSKTKLIVRHPERNNNIAALTKCGRNQCIVFRDWLYKDAHIYLERKKKVFDTYY